MHDVLEAQGANVVQESPLSAGHGSVKDGVMPLSRRSHETENNGEVGGRLYDHVNASRCTYANVAGRA